MPNGTLRATFAGVSTLLFNDGESAILTDGFFSRPGRIRCSFGKIAPDVGRIDQALSRLGVTKLDAVIATHSHYDHVMDAPTVADRTGALLVGSKSTEMVGRGAGLDEAMILVPEPWEPLALGAFTVTLVPTAHVPPDRLGGDITEPLVPPVKLGRYLMGACYSLLFEHGGRRILVQPTANANPGTLDRFDAEVVFLSIGLLGRQTTAYRDGFWRDTVEAVGAKRVYPIHWDDMWRALDDDPLEPMPGGADALGTSRKYLDFQTRETGVEVRMPVAFEAIDPFEGL